MANRHWVRQLLSRCRLMSLVTLEVAARKLFALDQLINNEFMTIQKLTTDMVLTAVYLVFRPWYALGL